MNKFIGIGFIGKKGIDLQFTQGKGTAVAKYSLSIPRAFQQGEKKEYDYISCVTFGKPAEFLANNGESIQKLCVEGHIQVRTWEKDGKKIYITEVITDSVEVVEWKAKGNNLQGFTPSEDDNLPPF